MRTQSRKIISMNNYNYWFSSYHWQISYSNVMEFSLQFCQIWICVNVNLSIQRDREIGKPRKNLRGKEIVEKWISVTCNGRCGGPPMLWWYMTSCFNCDDICAWLLWCFPISASASALLKIPSFNPEKMSPCTIDKAKQKIKFDCKKNLKWDIYCLKSLHRKDYVIMRISCVTTSCLPTTNYLILAWGMFVGFRSNDAKMRNHKFMCINYDTRTEGAWPIIHHINFLLDSKRWRATLCVVHYTNTFFLNAHERSNAMRFFCVFWNIYEMSGQFYIEHIAKCRSKEVTVVTANKKKTEDPNRWSRWKRIKCSKCVIFVFSWNVAEIQA